MDDTEKKLFKALIDANEKDINPGLSKIKWSTKGVLEGFVKLIRKIAEEIYKKLKMFKNNTEKIE